MVQRIPWLLGATALLGLSVGARVSSGLRAANPTFSVSYKGTDSKAADAPAPAVTLAPAATTPATTTAVATTPATTSTTASSTAASPSGATFSNG
ncbi:MAG TPA: hypothetical protein VKF37_11295, partial [Chloroflexota bacterium]|nr:hypothetical protein [Chloroflexota bacterium]